MCRGGGEVSGPYIFSYLLWVGSMSENNFITKEEARLDRTLCPVKVTLYRR